MRYGLLGTGVVGQTVGSKLVELGHEVRMGSREPGNEKAVEWARDAGEGAGEGSFADAASFGEAVINATSGSASLAALDAAGDDNLRGKLLIDIANPLDFSQGFPPTLTVCNDDSLAEQIQRAHPQARVVKTLNTVNAAVMVEPGKIPGSHTIFVSGDDEDAKREVAELLRSIGWGADDILDLGDISTARGPEMYLPLWLNLMGALGGPMFNIGVVKG